MKPSLLYTVLCAVGASKAALNILPLGDSITFGCGSDVVPGYWATCPTDAGGYRWPLYQYATAAGWGPFVYVGSVNMTGPTDMPVEQRRHEGHPGWRTDQILAVNATWLSYSPDIILIHLGTNDIGQARSVPSILANMATLLQLIQEKRPLAKVYVATILNMSNAAHPEWVPILAQYNAGLAGVVSAAVSAGQSASLVDINGETGLCPYGGQALVNGTLTQVCCNGNTPSSPNDWIHPTAAGYALMGQAWWRALQATV